jgi:hypothetical protein
MNKNKIIARVREKIAEKKSDILNQDYYPFSPKPHHYAPEHAIWFQTKDNMKAFVSVVNNKYRYEIYNKQNGKRIEEGYKSTLPLAKKEVFKYFEKN